MTEEKIDCKPCKIAGAIAVSTDICKTHNINCDDIYKAIDENKEPEQFITIIEKLRDTNKGEIKEQFNIVLDLIKDKDIFKME